MRGTDFGTQGGMYRILKYIGDEGFRPWDAKDVGQMVLYNHIRKFAMSVSPSVQQPRGLLRGHGDMQCTGSTKWSYRTSRSLFLFLTFAVFFSI